MEQRSQVVGDLPIALCKAQAQHGLARLLDVSLQAPVKGAHQYGVLRGMLNRQKPLTYIALD